MPAPNLVVTDVFDLSPSRAIVRLGNIGLVPVKEAHIIVRSLGDKANNVLRVIDYYAGCESVNVEDNPVDIVKLK
jgi:hypothetical protein